MAISIVHIIETMVTDIITNHMDTLLIIIDKINATAAMVEANWPIIRDIDNSILLSWKIQESKFFSIHEVSC